MLNRLPADERRAQLVASALAIAERGGVSSVTVRAVAEHAGVSVGAVHYCFETREALLTALSEDLIAQLSGSMRFAIRAGASSGDIGGVRGLRILLHSGLSELWRLIETTPRRHILTYELVTHSLRHRLDFAESSTQEAAGGLLAGEIAGEQYAMMDRQACDFLEECADQTGTSWVEPVPAIARLSLALLDGLVLRWLVDRDSEAILAQLDDVASLIASKAFERPVPLLDN